SPFRACHGGRGLPTRSVAGALRRRTRDPRRKLRRMGGCARDVHADAARSTGGRGRAIAAEFPYPDQGFLNFCLDSTGAPVGNLHDFLEMPMMWARDPNCLESEAAWNAWWTKNQPFVATVRMLRDELGMQWKVIANRVGVATTTAMY